MNVMENFLLKLDELPDLLDGKDLVALGLFNHRNGTYRARVMGYGPSYIKMPGKILYTKDAVKAYILQRYHEGSVPKSSQSTGELEL